MLKEIAAVAGLVAGALLARENPRLGNKVI